MNLDRYSCNVVIAGLMAQLCLPERTPPVHFIPWGPNEKELRFTYGSGVVSFYDIGNPSLQKKILSREYRDWYNIFFLRSEGFLKAYLI